MKRAVYAGSFDPLTNGHLWMIEQGARLFDELVVAIGENPEKQYLFSLEERLTMLREITGGLPGVRVTSFANQFLVNYADTLTAGYLLRGIRDERDYAYERGMRYVNGDLHPGITTIFLLPPRELSEVSSSFVKGLIGPDGWRTVVQRYVPATVFTRLTERFTRV